MVGIEGKDMSTRNQLTKAMQFTQPGQGTLTDQGWFWLNQLKEAQAPSGSGYVINADSTTYPHLSLSEGTTAELGTATDGNIFFATDTGIIYVANDGIWVEMNAAFTGDVTKPQGSTVLTLKSILLNPGTYTNPTITVDATGRITFIYNGAGSGSPGGVAGDVQINVGGSLFGADTGLFTYKAHTLTTPSLISNDVANTWQIPFHFGDGSPELICTIPPSTIISRVEVIIFTAFNGSSPSVSVGSVGGSYIELMGVSDCYPQIATTWITTPGIQYSIATALYIAITPGIGATQGFGQVSIWST